MVVIRGGKERGREDVRDGEGGACLSACLRVGANIRNATIAAAIVMGGVKVKGSYKNGVGEEVTPFRCLLCCCIFRGRVINHGISFLLP
jgi:hypothetical protein